ncbi:hypothetical protein PanWU01x14_274830 [Parasponia andersonii]|uniref:Uncharacterized protein n=1 Tax=Parasponia andersonii TaxID=3476 RepID=A0A2P5B3B6_PARAD|nr:hypothetical protein PanWU01x14_274830 [Parasponia andersonii]
MFTFSDKACRRGFKYEVITAGAFEGEQDQGPVELRFIKVTTQEKAVLTAILTVIDAHATLGHGLRALQPCQEGSVCLDIVDEST